jgi:hypothetical protein
MDETPAPITPEAQPFSGWRAIASGWGGNCGRGNQMLRTDFPTSPEAFRNLASGAKWRPQGFSPALGPFFKGIRGIGPDPRSFPDSIFGQGCSIGGTPARFEYPIF